jgi:hypothetical protein
MRTGPLRRAIDRYKVDERRAWSSIFGLPDPELVRGKRILVYDDVYTEGSHFARSLALCATGPYLFRLKTQRPLAATMIIMPAIIIST